MTSIKPLFSLTTICVFVLSLGSCAKNSTTAPNIPDTTTLVNGANYLPLTNFARWPMHASTVYQGLDDKGGLLESTQTEGDYKAVLGSAEQRGGRSVYPVFAFDTDGVAVSHSRAMGYAGLLGGEAFALNARDENNIAIVLPNTLAVGTSWNPAPEALSATCTSKLIQHFATYTTKGGTLYNDVIQIHVTYSDVENSRYEEYHKLVADADLYFANATGLVEAEVNSFDDLSYQEDAGNKLYYKHWVGRGVVYRQN